MNAVSAASAVLRTLRRQGVRRQPSRPPGRLPDARWRRADPLRRQGAQPQKPRRIVFSAQQCAAQSTGIDRQDCQYGSDDHQLRHRSVAARIQPHQEASAAVQRGIARRQELPLLASGNQSRISALEFLPRFAQGAGEILRPVPLRRRGSRYAAAAAEAVSHPQLRRQLLCEPLAAVPAIPDSTLHRRPAWVWSPRSITHAM